MPDAAPDLNDALNQLVQGLLAPSNAPVPRAQPVDTDSTRPTSWTGLLGEALSGGPPTDVQLTKAQREAAGARSLINFGIGMMGVGPFDSFGQGLAAGLTRAQESEYGSEGLAAQRQVDVQDWQQQQLQNRMQALKEAVPLLQLQMTAQQAARAQQIAQGGGGGAIPGTTPGTNLGEVAGRADFVTKFTPIAQNIADKTGLPLNYILGQAGLETGWGTSSASRNNNFFGIMDPQTGRPMSYATPQAGAQAYIDLMASDRYKNVPRTGSPRQIGDAMALAGYNPNVPQQGSPDSYGVRVGNFAASLPRPAQPAAAVPAVPGGNAPIVGQSAPAAAPSVPGGNAPVVAPPAPPAQAQAPPDFVVPGANAQMGATAPLFSRYQVAGPDTGPPASSLGLIGQAARLAEETPPGQPIPIPPVTPAAATPPGAVPGQPAAGAPQATDKFVFQPPTSYPSDEIYSPNLTADQQASFARQRALIPTLPLQDQPAAYARLESDQRAAADAKRSQAAEAQAKYQSQQFDQQQKQWQANVQADIDRQKAVQQQRLDIGKEAQTQDMQRWNAQLKNYSDAAHSAELLAPQYAQLRTVLTDPSAKIPSGLVGGILQAHPNLAGYLSAAGIISGRDADQTQIINGLTNFLSVEMRPTGSGSLRGVEMSNFKSALPTLLESPNGRLKALAFLSNYANRVMSENDFAQEYYMRPDANGQPTRNLLGLQKAMDASKERGGLGEVVQHMPKSTWDSYDDARNWITSNVAVGDPYYGPEKLTDSKGRPLLNQDGSQQRDWRLQVRLN